MHAFLHKLAEANRLIFRLCTLDVPKAREEVAQKEIFSVRIPSHVTQGNACLAIFDEASPKKYKEGKTQQETN